MSGSLDSKSREIWRETDYEHLPSIEFHGACEYLPFAPMSKLQAENLETILLNVTWEYTVKVSQHKV